MNLDSSHQGRRLQLFDHGQPGAPRTDESPPCTARWGRPSFGGKAAEHHELPRWDGEVWTGETTFSDLRVTQRGQGHFHTEPHRTILKINEYGLFHLQGVLSEEELTGVEHASATAAEISTSMMRLKMELEEKKRTVHMLQAALVRTPYFFFFFFLCISVRAIQ